MKFITNDTEYTMYNGMDVEVIRELTSKECDIEEIGTMYKVKFEDGTVIDCFADELY